MLSKPTQGWTEITIGDFTGNGSYIQDLPVLFMEAFIRALRYNIPAEVMIDEEGSSFIIRSLDSTTVIARRAISETHTYAIDARALAIELLSDLRRDWQDWLTWPPEYNPNHLSKREQLSFCSQRAAHLTRLADTLEKLL